MVEEAAYKVIERLENEVEVRDYSGHVWAATVSSSDNSAFMALLSYISGRNERKEEIPMTVPVITRDVPEGVMLAFVMPSDLQEPPKPKTSDIEIKEIKGLHLAVLPFSGYATYEDRDRSLKILVNTLKKKGMETKGGPLLLQYSSPWTPPSERRNEIAVEI